MKTNISSEKKEQNDKEKGDKGKDSFFSNFFGVGKQEKPPQEEKKT